MSLKKNESLWEGPQTVAEFIDLLRTFPPEWEVKVSTQAGGGISIEHREIGGKPFVAIFGKNGGRFGENPLTEEEYKKQSANFLTSLKNGYLYTSAHGDHRLYLPSTGSQATCYGQHYDLRIIERMVQEGLVRVSQVDLERVAKLHQRQCGSRPKI